MAGVIPPGYPAGMRKRTSGQRALSLPTAEHSKLMSIGLNDRLIGRPARATGLIKFLDYLRRVE